MRRVRDECGLTTSEFANAIGCSASLIQQIELRKRKPGKDTVCLIVFFAETNCQMGKELMKEFDLKDIELNDLMAITNPNPNASWWTLLPSQYSENWNKLSFETRMALYHMGIWNSPKCPMDTKTPSF